MNLLAGRDKQPLLHWAAEEVERSKSLSAHSHHPGVTWHVIGFKNIDNRSLVDSNTSGNVWPTQWLTSTSFSSIYQPLDALGGLDALKQRNPTWWACSSKGQPVNVKLLNWTGRAWALSILKTLFCKLAVLKNLQTCTFFFFWWAFHRCACWFFFRLKKRGKKCSSSKSNSPCVLCCTICCWKHLLSSVISAKGSKAFTSAKALPVASNRANDALGSHWLSQGCLIWGQNVPCGWGSLNETKGNCGN